MTDSVEIIQTLGKEKKQLSAENQKLREEIVALKKQLALDAEKAKSNARMEELKDIHFGQLLGVAIDPRLSELNILKIVTSGVKRVIGNEVEVTLYQMRTVEPDVLQMIVSHERIELSDLVTQERVLYCLIDTELDEGVNQLEKKERYLTLKANTVLGDTEKYGEGIVSKKNLETGERVKYFRYADYDPHRFKYGGSNDNHSDFRISFPIYHIGGEEQIDKIEYILLIRNMGDIPFTNSQIRAIRGYGNYGTLALSIKQLIEKDREILEKDRKIEQQDRWIISGIRRYLHNIATPLSTIENIVSYLNEIMDGETDHAMSKKYSVMLTQVNKVKHTLQNIRDTITATKYYQQAKNKPVCTIKESRHSSRVELDSFILEYLNTVNFEESYGSRIKFSLELNAKGIEVLLDKTKMAYILDNAIRNTFQQSETNRVEGITFEIRTMHNNMNNTIALFLRDFAGGLSEEQYARFDSGDSIQTTKQNGTGEGIPTILDYFKEMGCKDVELVNFMHQGVLYTAAFPALDD